MGGSGTVTPKITTDSPLPEGTVGVSYTATLEATGNDITWSSNGMPEWMTLDSSTGVISGPPTTADTYTFTVTATNDSGSDSKQFTLTIEAAANVPVDSVSLDKTSLTLTEGGTETLTATITPDNATNKAVMWSSDNESVATVVDGIVTAVAPGTATITATAADGSGKTAACTVTVERPYVPPANPNYRIDVTATEGGTVDKDPAAAKAGETVTLTPAPEEGYEVGEVIVTDRFGDTVDVTANPDGTYTFTMPNGQVKVEVTFVEVQPEPLPFTDVSETDWFHDAVRYVYDNGLMDGVGDGQFAPNATTNRAMVVTILHRLAGEPAVAGDVGFTDVEPGLWYTDAVAWAAQKGIVNGISETEFSPSGDLTREQLATILYRYAESAGYDVSAQADLSGFPDAGDIQSYATEALSWAVAEGLLQGFEDDSLQPGGTATRAQIATILMRFLAAVPTA
ncbi:S-layer homology domain-containing protein [Evtepia sp.]